MASFICVKMLLGKITISVVGWSYKMSYKGSIGKVLNRMFSSFLSLIGLSYFRIESVESYYNSYKQCIINPLINERIGVCGNYITTKSQADYQIRKYNLPDLRLTTFSSVIISGNSDMIIDLENKCIINDFCYNINPHVFFVDGLLYRQKNNIGILRNNLRNISNSFETGILISGKFSSNYYHTVFENLNRLIILNSCKISEDVPFLIDEKVLSIPSFKRVYEILTKNSNRKSVVLKSNVPYKCNTLFYVDHINYLAPHVMHLTKYNDEFVYDPMLLKNLRSQLLMEASAKVFPKHVFITRANTKSRHFNEEEVFTTLKEFGFESIAPENYSFEDQMTMFRDAEWIIGGSGAAMTNLLFCSPGSNIICFRSSNQGEEPPIFNTVAYINGCHFWYMEPKESKDINSIHSDYRVDTKELKSFLIKWGCKKS